MSYATRKWENSKPNVLVYSRSDTTVTGQVHISGNNYIVWIDGTDESTIFDTLAAAIDFVEQQLYLWIDI